MLDPLCSRSSEVCLAGASFIGTCSALLARCMARQRCHHDVSCCGWKIWAPRCKCMQREAIAAKKARTGLAKDDEWEGDSFVKQSESMVAN